MEDQQIACFYVPEGYSPATQYYVNIIKEALQRKGYKCIDAVKLRQVPKGVLIVTIRPLEFMLSYLVKAPAKTLTWFQGITPEEIRMMFRPSLRRFLKIKLHTLAECFCLKRTGLAMFVSRRMGKHYHEKYGITPKHVMVMPCFNHTLDEDLIRTNGNTLNTPSFVYAGNMAPWQCIDQTLILFKKIKELVPRSVLTIYTADKEEALRKLKAYDVEAIVDFKTQRELHKALAQHKYGFIVRENIDINNVATPTKMNSYMAAGLIPIYSDVVDSFREHLSGCSYTVPFTTFDECVKKIRAIEDESIDIESLIERYRDLFNEYWNRESYISEIVKNF